ncbi:hypothetical protein Pint_30397 [Pistacia integerrima]|uniref:Uncharacterized protein n=1 Tax=Pistacia integerrima TaxID=434235 RepID=A0ACC0WXE4_9ROSI|nr:hypothetical protein Pint_30397 [Pistacia integerrima]
MQYLETIRNLKLTKKFQPIRTIHVSYVPDEEIGAADGMAKFVESKEFRELSVGFVMDEGQASTNDDFRVFYADRAPWNLKIKAVGVPGHGSRIFDNRKAANSKVISVNPVYLKAGTPSPTGFVMNMQPSEAEAGFNIRLPPTADPDLLQKNGPPLRGT